ncbi:hypothetical protein DUNSADRAFT_6102 [Dunaliella salina]|uniref:Encoded protein n=1 Tax=Dunaliella salina TaxID=3046 RepID=A0ABQ7H702_DUNSA|nr:hypothetical protein DUNSADRAFT_6102 [Dunaliella salina]|eukprot:KAF5842632.1 hypothetical protein DUNSADRAFT_6102 [Dunaliella salina]
MKAAHKIKDLKRSINQALAVPSAVQACAQKIQAFNVPADATVLHQCAMAKQFLDRFLDVAVADGRLTAVDVQGITVGIRSETGVVVSPYGTITVERGPLKVLEQHLARPKMWDLSPDFRPSISLLLKQMFDVFEQRPRICQTTVQPVPHTSSQATERQMAYLPESAHEQIDGPEKQIHWGS